MRSTLLEKLQSRTTVTDDGSCWEWTGAKNSYGYGMVLSGKKLLRAHRVMYEMTFDDIPSGMFVMHSCDNPGCVNPDHLSLGTPLSNSNDMVLKGRSHGSRKNLPRGVSKVSGYNKWMAQSWFNGKTHYGGCFDSIELAATAALKLRDILRKGDN